MATLAENGFEELKVIGRGQYGKAHLVKSTKDQGTYVAKTIDLTCLSAKERQTSIQEVALLRRLAHPNIVDYKENFWMGDTLVIIMQHCECGDLAAYIKDMSKRKMKLREVQIMKYFVQVLHALQYIHQERILHRDLKSSNLFLLKRRTLLKVGDFGISRVLEGSVQAAITVVGTPYYMPPEVCENKPYTYKSDVWALGCVLYELCQQKHAFSADNLLGLVYKIVSDKYEPIPRLYSQALNTLVQRTLEKVADKRPTVNDLLADSYVQTFAAEYARAHQQPLPKQQPCTAAPALGTTLRRSCSESQAGIAATRAGGGKAWAGGKGTAEGDAGKDAPAGPTAIGFRRSITGPIEGGPAGKGAGRRGGPLRGPSPAPGVAGRGREMPREAALRRRREAADRKGAELAGTQRGGRLGQKAKQPSGKSAAAASSAVTAGSPVSENAVPLDPPRPLRCPLSPGGTSLVSTNLEEPIPKPNEAWALHNAGRPGTVHSDVDEISEAMSSAEEYESDFEEEYEGEEDMDKAYSVVSEVDELSEVEEMEVGSVEFGNLPAVPEEEEFTRVLSHFESDYLLMRSTTVSPPNTRRLAVDRVGGRFARVDVGLPGAVSASASTASLAMTRAFRDPLP